ncbi:MAG: hypothetical protein KDA98_12480, partial [Acidimicrobiales bacterium]|nr:hypothetical protein [Acidimicrobiales bacterium]
AFAVASATLVWAASRPGPVAAALSWRPLRGLGLISYGLYLYHWPVVVLLSFPRVDWAPVPLFVARVAISLALAIASYVAIEQPIRRGNLAWPTRNVLWAGAGALATAILVVFLAVPAAPEPEVAAPAPAVVEAPRST